MRRILTGCRPMPCAGAARNKSAPPLVGEAASPLSSNRSPPPGIQAMRRTALALLATLPLLPATGHAQSGAPHSWLFGEWTGGLFPAPANLTAQACLGQPTVIFTRDVVIRGSLTEVNFTQ